MISVDDFVPYAGPIYVYDQHDHLRYVIYVGYQVPFGEVSWVGCSGRPNQYELPHIDQIVPQNFGFDAEHTRTYIRNGHVRFIAPPETSIQSDLQHLELAAGWDNWD